MPDFVGRDKTAGNEIMFENVGNPLGIALVGFLSANSFDVLGVSKDNVTRLFKDVVDGNPIFTGRFHTNVTAVVFRQPDGKQTQVVRESGKAAGFVGSNAVGIGRSDAGNNERLVDVHTAADGINDFQRQQNTSNKKDVGNRP